MTSSPDPTVDPQGGSPGVAPTAVPDLGGRGARMLRFEVRRAATLRSSYVFTFIGVLAGAWMALVPVWLFPPETLQDIHYDLDKAVAQITNPLALVFLTAVAVQAFGHDYRDGTMRLVLSQFPDRRRVFAAKLLVPAAVGAGAYALTATVVAAVLAIGHGMHLRAGVGHLALALFAGLSQTLWWGAVSASFVVHTRNLAAGFVVPMLGWLVVEGLVTASLSDVAPKLGDYLPFTASSAWAHTMSAQSGLVTLTWGVLAVGTAWVVFRRRDA